MTIRFFAKALSIAVMASLALLASAPFLPELSSAASAPAGVAGTQIASGPTGSGVAVRAREVLSVRELARSQANLDFIRTMHEREGVEIPHNLPFGVHNETLPRMTHGTAIVKGKYAVVPTYHTSGFTGLYDGEEVGAGDPETEPPDQAMAVNNSEIVEMVNNLFQVFNSSGKSLSGPPLATEVFFNAGSAFLSDPEVQYDPTTKRWFMEELYINGSKTGFMVAASETGDPLGSWWVYTIDGLTSGVAGCGTSCVTDYPKVGFDANGLYIAANLWTQGKGSKFIDGAIYALPKAVLETGSGFSYIDFILNDFAMQPMINAPGTGFVTAANGTEYFMEARDNDGANTDVRVLSISNTNDIVFLQSKLYYRWVDLTSQNYVTPVASTQPDVIGPYGQSVGATSAPQLDGGYGDFGSGVKFSQGRLFGAVTMGSTDGNGLKRNVIAWFVVQPKVTNTSLAATMYKQGYLAPPNGNSLSYPDFAINKSGNGILGMSLTDNSSRYPSTAFIGFTGYATTGPIVVVGGGYTSDDGFTGYSKVYGQPGGVGRWGDYGAAAVDPTNQYFYFANEFISNSTKYPRGTGANWGTRIEQIY